MPDYIPDYTELHAMYEADRERALSKYPICCSCKERITGDYFYNIGGKKYCESCLNEDYRVDIDAYLED